MTNKERFKEIFISQVTRPGAADLLAWLGTTDFFEAPASTRFHGAYPGGLVEHSLNVYYALLGQSTIREYGGESVAVVALLHDVCKTGYYRRERDGKYSVKDRLPMGHGEKSVYLVMKFMDLTDEEALAIRWHMGGFEAAPGSVYCGLPVGLCRRNRGDRGDQEQVCPADAAGLCPAAAGIPGTGGPPGWMEIHGDHNSG